MLIFRLQSYFRESYFIIMWRWMDNMDPILEMTKLGHNKWWEQSKSVSSLRDKLPVRHCHLLSDLVLLFFHSGLLIFGRHRRRLFRNWLRFVAVTIVLISLICLREWGVTKLLGRDGPPCFSPQLSVLGWHTQAEGLQIMATKKLGAFTWVTSTATSRSLP